MKQVKRKDDGLQIVVWPDQLVEVSGSLAAAASTRLGSRVEQVPFDPSFTFDHRAFLSLLCEAMLRECNDRLATLLPRDFERRNDYMCYFEDASTLVYYVDGFVRLVPKLRDDPEWPFEPASFAFPSQLDAFRHALKDRQDALAIRASYIDLQSRDYRVTRERLIRGSLADFFVHTCHPRCIISSTSGLLALHYVDAELCLSLNSLPLLDISTITDGEVGQFALASELRGHVDFEWGADGLAEVTSIPHLSSIRHILIGNSYSAAIIVHPRYACHFDNRERLAFESANLEDALAWIRRQVDLLAILQQAELLQRPACIDRERPETVKVGDSAVSIDGRLRSIFALQ